MKEIKYVAPMQLIRKILEQTPILTYVVLFLFGAILAFFIVKPYYHLDAANYMPSRMQTLNGFLTQEKQGAGLLNIIEKRDHNTAYYLYLSYIARVLKNYDPAFIFLNVQMWGMFLLFAAFPAMIYLLRQSLLTALISPFLLYLLVRDNFLLYLNDSYWALGWVILFTIPLFGMLFRKDRMDATYWTLVWIIGLTIGISNLPRAHAGMICEFILIAAIIKLAWRQLKIGKNPMRIFLCTFLALVVSCGNYFMFTKIIPAVYIKSHGMAGSMQAFGPWHTLYIGLGWDNDTKIGYFQNSNAYNIVYKDECAMARAQSIVPQVEYLSKEYFGILQDEYFRILKYDPIFFVGSYIKKGAACFAQGLLELWRMKVLLFLWGICYFILRYHFKQQKIFQEYHCIFKLLLFCFFFDFLFGLMATP